MATMAQKLHKSALKVRQACECCRARKIRCDSYSPCSNCQRMGTTCVYPIPKKKGPKKREAPKDTVQTPTDVHNDNETSESQVSTPSGSHFRPSALLPLEIMQHCLTSFFQHKYPTTPILDREEVYASLHHLDDAPTQYGLITALCASIILQTEILSPSTKEWVSKQVVQDDLNSVADFLMNETSRARTFSDQIENPSLVGVQTSYFLFTCLSRLGRDNLAWFHLREAITMLQLLRLHEESTYTALESPYSENCRRTFWLLINTERAYALQKHRPLTLRRSISPPVLKDASEDRFIGGFLDSIALFRNFGEGFMWMWNSPENLVSSPRPLVRLQEFLECAISNVRERTEIQQADLLVCRQWLKMIVWQLCLSKGQLSSNATANSMSFHFPVDIARDVILVSRFLPLAAFQANGIAILEKVFDIGNSLADLLLVHPSILHTSGFEVGPKDYLMELVRIMGMEIEGNSKYLQLLATRADECLGVRLPRSLSSNGGSPKVYDLDWDRGIEDCDELDRSPLSLA